MLTERTNLPITVLCLLAFCVSTSTIAQGYKGFNVGQYQGQAYNKTGKNYGKATLDIRRIGTDGSVQAYLRDSDGLEGAGPLAGTINVNGVMQLSGPMTSPSDKSVWQSAFMAVMNNGQLRMGNRLTLGNVVQEETAMMAYAGGPAPARPVAAANNAPATPAGNRAPTEAEVKAYFKDWWTHDCKAEEECTVTFDSPVRIAGLMQKTFQIGGTYACYPVKVDFTTSRLSNGTISRMHVTNAVYYFHRNSFGEWEMGKENERTTDEQVLKFKPGPGNYPKPDFSGMEQWFEIVSYTYPTPPDYYMLINLVL